MHRRNWFIDNLKGISCILVVFLHCQFPGMFGKIMEALSRIAVPFFFASAGFFAAKASQVQLFKRIKSVCKMIVIAAIFYIPYSCYYEIYMGYVDTFKEYFYKYFNLIGVAELLLLNNSQGIAYHLWFLFALLYCYLIFAFLKNRNKSIVIISFILLAIGYFSRIIILALNRFDVFSISTSVIYCRNWLLLGLPCFLLGTYSYVNTRRMDASKAVPMIIGGMILCILERFVIYNTFRGGLEIYIGTILQLVGILKIAKQYEMKSVNILQVLGEKYSSLIYLMHVGVIYFVDILAKRYKILFEGSIGYLKPLVVLEVTLLLCYIVKKVEANIMCRKNMKTIQ